MAVSIEMAVITATLGLAGIIIAKENKTSEFRQKWIDDLRCEISDLKGKLSVMIDTEWGHLFDKRNNLAKSTVAHNKYHKPIFLGKATCISVVNYPPQPEKSKSTELTQMDISKILADHLADANKSFSSIELRLNTSDKRDLELLKKLDTLRKTFDVLMGKIAKGDWVGNQELGKLQEFIDFEKAEETFINAAREILKNEWERVKKGEWLFRRLKWIGFLFLIGGITIYIFDVPDRCLKLKLMQTENRNLTIYYECKLDTLIE